MDEKIVYDGNNGQPDKKPDFTSPFAQHDEKIPHETDLGAQTARRQSIGGNIIENPLTVSGISF